MAVPNLTANSPVTGSIAWSAFSIQYGGVGYSVAAGSTPNKYVWWVYNGGSPSLQAGNTLPTNLTDDDIVLFVNKAGVPVNVQASTVIEGSLVVDGSIVGSALAAGSVHGDRITGGTLQIGQIANLQSDLDAKASETYVQSRGTDLVTNGTGLMGDNTNFSWAIFDPSDAPAGASGSFRTPTKGGQTRTNDELIPVDLSKSYIQSAWIRETTSETDSRCYIGAAPYDAYGGQISPQHYMFRPGTTTTLAAALNPGDTTITVASTANWKVTAGSAGHWRNIIFWDYVDAGGKAWPEETFSKNFIADAYADGGIAGNVITLRTPYAGTAKPIGTKLSNGGSGGTYLYWAASNKQATPVWVLHKSPVITGLHTMPTTPGADPSSAQFAFPQGTAAVKMVFLTNRTVSAPSNNPNAQQAFAGISFSDASAAQETALASRTLAVDDLKTLWGHPLNTTFIDGGDIYTNSILAQSIAVSDFTNYLAGSDWEGTHPWPLGTRMSVATDQFYSGTKSLKIVGTGGSTSTGAIKINNVVPGEEYYIEFWARRDAAWNGQSTNSKVRVANQSAAFLYDVNFSAATLSAADTWVKRTGSFVVPAGTTGFSITIVSDATAGNVWIDNLIMRRRFGGELIVDGSIKTAQLDANAITSKHTITGPLFQTNAAANRGIKIVSSANNLYGSLIAYDAAGNAHLTINGETGSITMEGDLTTGSKVTGGIITGGTVQTQVEASRGIKMTSAGLIGYDAAGAAKFTLTPTGGLTVDNPIVTTGTITGATITGGVLQTSLAANRGIKMVNGYFVTYDASGNQTLSIDGATGAIAMKGTLTSGSTITGATIDGGTVTSTAGNGSKAIMTAGSVQMFSNLPTEVATGGMTAGSWVWNGVTAAQTTVESPRVSGNAAGRVRVWQGNDGKAGAELWASPTANVQVDDTSGLVHMNSRPGSIMFNGFTKNLAKPVDWRWTDFCQPTGVGHPPDNANRTAYIRTFIPWPAGASYAHISFHVKGYVDGASATDAYWSLMKWDTVDNTQYEIDLGYSHNTGNSGTKSQIGHALQGWTNAPQRGLAGQSLHLAVNLRSTGAHWIGCMPTSINITFFS